MWNDDPPRKEDGDVGGGGHPYSVFPGDTEVFPGDTEMDVADVADDDDRGSSKPDACHLPWRVNDAHDDDDDEFHHHH